MQRRHLARACTLVVLALLAVADLAQAQAPAGTERPDVMLPEALQREVMQGEVMQQAATEHSSPMAAALYAEGTSLFKQWRFEEAEQKFREALTHWDHPLIHLYLSRTLEKQGRVVEAYEILQQALRAGVESFPPGDIREAEYLRKGLVSRLAQIEVHCDVPGAEVTLDGEPWFTAPGRAGRMILAGQHVLAARKPGYFPVTEAVSLFPGKKTRVVLSMTVDMVHVERRWRPWQPWTVASAGLATTLAGGLLLWQARTDYAAIERELEACEEVSCDRTSTWRLDRAEWKERIGTGALIVGGSVLAAGLAGALLNQPRSSRSEPTRGLESLHIVPMFSGDGAGISAWIQF